MRGVPFILAAWGEIPPEAVRNLAPDPPVFGHPAKSWGGVYNQFADNGVGQCVQVPSIMGWIKGSTFLKVPGLEHKKKKKEGSLRMSESIWCLPALKVVSIISR